MFTHIPRRTLIAACAACGMLAPAARGHALEYRPVQGGIGIQALYDDGRPAAFSPVQVFAPGSTQVFAEGMTDRDGRYLFAPVADGVWRITVDDGMGHALDEALPVAGGGLRAAGEPARMGRWSGALAGIGTIFGVFGLWALLRGGRRKAGG